MSLSLNYKGEIAPGNIVNRILGPDGFGARYVVTGVEYEPEADRTRADLRPLHPDDPRAIRDEFGQQWFAEWIVLPE